MAQAGRHLASRTRRSHTKLSRVVVLVTALTVFAAGIASADIIQNNVVAGGNDTITAGGSTAVSYVLQVQGGGVDGQGGCNASSAQPVTVTLDVPDDVTASTTAIQFTGCNEANSQSVTFSSDVPGAYAIEVSAVTGGGGGSFTNDANFTLHVLAGADDTPPSILSNITGTLGNDGWYVSDVTLEWTVIDDESDITTTTGCETVSITEDQDEVTYTCEATSAGGTASENVTIKRDATAPTITATLSPEANDAGWNNTDVSVTFSCDDNLSGVASCEGDTTLDGEGTGQSATGTAADAAGNTASLTVDNISIDKSDPTISASRDPAANSNGWNNSDVTVTFTCADGLSGVASCTTPTVVSTEGANQSVTGTAVDNAGNTATATVSGISIDKTHPVVSNVGPMVLGVGESVAVEATVTDEGGSGVAVTEYSIDGGNTWSDIAEPLERETADVLELCVRATDLADNEAVECVLLAIYDPSAGFVTGGGWIDSPAGAYTADETLTGKATFGFVAKYKKGANVPDGNTEFQFKAGDLNFKSTSYEWLVVAGQKAQFKGEGTVNGESGYGFMLSAVDGAPDTFRMKITGPGGLVYDNQMGAADTADASTVLGGGSIVVHTPNGKNK